MLTYGMGDLTMITRLSYDLPLYELLNAIDDIEEQYVNNNPKRLRLIQILKCVCSLINDVSLPNQHYSEEALKKIIKGAYIFCLIYIGKKSNSSLYRLIVERIGYIDEQSSFIYLTHFHHFTQQHEHLLGSYLSEASINADEVRNELSKVISLKLSSLHPIIQELSQKVPPKKVLLEGLRYLEQNYIDAKTKQESQRLKSCIGFFTSAITPNPERETLAQLARALWRLIQNQQDNSLERQTKTLDVYHRVIIGYLWFIAKSIDNKCFSSATNWSELSRLTVEALHMLHINDVNSFMTLRMQMVCLTTLEDFLNDRSNVLALEAYAEKKFADNNLLEYIQLPIRKIRKELAAMNDELAETTVSEKYPAAVTLSEFCEWFTKPIGYGIGSFPGFMLSKTEAAAKITVALAGMINASASALHIGTSGGIAGYLAASYINEAMPIRASAKMCEYIISRVSYYMGGAIGAVLFDLPYQGVCELYKLLQQHDPALSDEITHYEFVECLKETPANLFPDAEDRKRVEIFALDDSNLSLSQRIKHAGCVMRSKASTESINCNYSDESDYESDIDDSMLKFRDSSSFSDMSMKPY